MLDCNHCPIALDEAPNSAAPTLVVCQICQEVVEAVGYEPKQPHKVRFVFRIEEVSVPA